MNEQVIPEEIMSLPEDEFWTRLGEWISEPSYVS
jgi:hypothetical protein